MNYPSVLASSTLFWSLPPEKWFRYAREYGLAGIEVWAQQLESNSIHAGELRRLARQYGAELTVHSYSWDLNLISMNKAERAVALELTKKAIRLAAFLDAKQVTIHPGRELFPAPGLDYDRLLAKTSSVLGSYAAQWGTTASFEIMEKIQRERLTSAEAVRRMEMAARTSISWKYTVDLAHCDRAGEAESLAVLLNGQISEFHVSNKKGTKRHIADVAAGDFDLPLLLAALAPCGLPYVLEGLDFSADAAMFKHIMTYLGMEGERTNENKKDSPAIGLLCHSDHHLGRLRQ